MADAVTQTISLALYRYLCKKIVGTEDHVKQIRLMNAVRDYMSGSPLTTIITSGSWGEGLEMRGSDIDIMLVHKRIEVCEDVIHNFNPNITYFLMERDDVQPCYTKLKLEHSSSQDSFDSYSCWEEHNSKHYYSSTLCKQISCVERSRIHGPCVTDEQEIMDGAISLHSKTWVSPAVEWITRSRNAWPSHYLKQSIIKHGVLFVPIGVKGSPNEDLEWRISFSVGEKLLINNFTHTQLLCYALLKIILKDVISNFSGCKDLLCSYFLKTIMFWMCEELPQSVWKPCNVVPCFMKCFSRLIYCVEYSVCLHYFIPENNMFENKIEGPTREQLLKKLDTLHRYGWRCILFSDQISHFNISMWNCPLETHTSYVNEVDKTLQSKALFLSENIMYALFRDDEFNVCHKVITQAVSFKPSATKHLYQSYMSKLCNAFAQCIPLDCTFFKNKYRYRQYKSCLSSLLKNIHHDALTGWLMVASFFYKTKQYKNALYIVTYSISKCTSEKMYRCMTLTEKHYQFLNLQIFRKKSFSYLKNIMMVDDIHLHTNSTLIPDELQTYIGSELVYLQSTAYAFFLKFLCHYHLSDVRKCQDSLKILHLVIIEKYLLAGGVHTDKNDCLLLIALKMLQLLNDK